jgi:Arc/MetJ-type ribon-helix-helix transcriptional regulator
MDQEVSVPVRLNQQQEQMIQRLIDEGGYGDSPAAVIRDVFLRFCKSHPEFLRVPAAK